MSPLKTEALIYGVAALVGVGVVVLIATRGQSIGRALGAGAVNTVGGVVLGAGSALGLPDPSDARTVAEGRNALDRGDYLEASQKLPALEFLNGIGSRFGGWLADKTHPIAPAAGGSVVFYTDWS